MSSPIIVLVELMLAGVLALLAAADLVFVNHEWSATRRVIAWITLVFLTTSAALAFALLRNIPSWTIWIVVGAGLGSFVCALFSAGRFRLLAAAASVVWLVAILPLVFILGSAQFVR
jgi:hypothetical protein